jgi:uncharacterized protein (TIGR03435 family)
MTQPFHAASVYCVMNRTAAFRLTVVALVAVIGTVVIAGGQIPGLSGPPVDPEARFEVVSIKPFDSASQPQVNMSPGRWEYAGFPSRQLSAQAVRMPTDRVLGFPDWIDKERYAFAAKAGSVPAPSAAALSVMVANLVKDRFKLVTHLETRDMAVYNLVFAREDKRFGPALKESSAECRAKLAARSETVRRGDPEVAASSQLTASFAGCISARLNPGDLAYSGSPMAFLAQFLTQAAGRPVIDKTGLTSYYDFSLKWTPDVGGGVAFGQIPGTSLPPADTDAANLFTAVQEQLGLKLESARAQVAVVVIDHIEKPVLD